MPRKPPTTDEVLQMLLADFERTGRSPTARDWRKAEHGHCQAQTARKVFGNIAFAEIVAQAGLPPATRGPFGPPPRWTKKTIPGAFRRFHAAHGRAPTTREWSSGNDEHPSKTRVEQVYGSWNAGVTASGIPINRAGEWEEQACLEAIKTHAAATGHGPSYSDWEQAAPDRPTSATLVRLFGSVEQANAAAGVAQPSRPQAERSVFVERIPDADELKSLLEPVFERRPTTHDSLRAELADLQRRFFEGERPAEVTLLGQSRPVYYVETGYQRGMYAEVPFSVPAGVRVRLDDAHRTVGRPTGFNFPLREMHPLIGRPVDPEITDARARLLAALAPEQLVLVGEPAYRRALEAVEAERVKRDEPSEQEQEQLRATAAGERGGKTYKVLFSIRSLNEHPVWTSCSCRHLNCVHVIAFALTLWKALSGEQPQGYYHYVPYGRRWNAPA